MIEIFEDDLFIYMALEYQKQGSLLAAIMVKQIFSEKEAKVILEQILLAVDFMH